MKIVTAVVNNPVFIEIQYYTLKKYFKSDYEFIVFNDAKDFPDFTNSCDLTLKQQIREVCDKLNIVCIDIPNSHHQTQNCAVIRCADSMNYILKYQKEHPDKYLLLDSDMFLLHDFDIDRYSAYDCAVVMQSRGEGHLYKYIWNGIYYFDFTKMKNIELLDWSASKDCDVGGAMQEWIKKQFGDKYIPYPDQIIQSDGSYNTNELYLIRHLVSCKWDINDLPDHLKANQKLIDFLNSDPRNENQKFFCEIYDGSFLHYRAGGNWRMEGINFHKQLTESLYHTLVES